MKNILYIIIIGLLVTGCRSGRSVNNRYYLMEYPPDVSVNLTEETAASEKTCYVHTVSVHPAFSASQIAFRESSNEISYYAFNQWANRPEPVFTRMLVEFLEKTNIFHDIVMNSSPDNADFSLETSVQRLEVVNENNDYHAHLQVRFRLIENESGKILTEHNAKSNKEMKERDLNLFALGVSEIFIEELSVFANQFLTTLNQTNQQK